MRKVNLRCAMGKKQGQMGAMQPVLSLENILSQAQGKTEPRDKQKFEKSQ
jgi:hypothetical protein